MSLKYEPASVTTTQVKRAAFANPADVVKAALTAGLVTLTGLVTWCLSQVNRAAFANPADVVKAATGLPGKIGEKSGPLDLMVAPLTQYPKST